MIDNNKLDPLRLAMIVEVMINKEIKKKNPHCSTFNNAVNYHAREFGIKKEALNKLLNGSLPYSSEIDKIRKYYKWSITFMFNMKVRKYRKVKAATEKIFWARDEKMESNDPYLKLLNDEIVDSFISHCKSAKMRRDLEKESEDLL